MSDHFLHGVLNHHEQSTRDLVELVDRRVEEIGHRNQHRRLMPAEDSRELLALSSLKAVLNRLPDAYRKVRECE